MKAFKYRSHLELATLVLVPLALFISLATLVSLLPPATRGAAAAAPYLQNAGFDRRVQWYFESGQWRADVETLVAVVKYLVEPEPTQASIQPSQLHHNPKDATEMRVAAETVPNQRS